MRIYVLPGDAVRIPLNRKLHLLADHFRLLILVENRQRKYCCTRGVTDPDYNKEMTQCCINGARRHLFRRFNNIAFSPVPSDNYKSTIIVIMA